MSCLWLTASKDLEKPIAKEIDREGGLGWSKFVAICLKSGKRVEVTDFPERNRAEVRQLADIPAVVTGVKALESLALVIRENLGGMKCHGQHLDNI